MKDEIIKLSIAVSVVCIVFLFHLPSALVVILTLPFAIIISFVCMYYLGVTSNIMSLGGIAIAIGAMVDASIIMVENAHKKLEEWEAEGSPGNRIHVNDLVTCCVAALDETIPAGIVNVGDGDHRSSTWFAQEVARQAGLPEPRLIDRTEAELEFSRLRLAFLSSSRIVDTTRMREVLGVTPRYAKPEEGIRASLGL